MIFNTLFFIAEKLMIPNANPLVGGVYIYLTITELSGLSILLYFAYQQAQALFDFEQAVGQLSFGKDFLSPMPSIEDSMHDIQTHMHFSRRHTTPLSVIVAEPEPESLQRLIQNAFYEAHRTLQTHCSLTKLATLFKPALRRTDLLIESRPYGRLLIVCPGTAPQEILTLTNRLQTTADEHEMSIRFGYASFPNEAYTFDELVLQAESQLHREPSATPPEPEPAHVASGVLADVKTCVD